MLLLLTVMLQWFVNEEVCTVVLKDCGKLIEENEVEVRPEKLPDAAIDESYTKSRRCSREKTR